MCFCLAPRFSHPFSLWLSLCLTFHLCFSACLGPLVYALVSRRLSHIFAFFVWLPLYPSFQPPSVHTPRSPVYDIPRAGRWAGLQQRGGERETQPPPQLLTFTLQASADGRGGEKPSCQLGGGDWAVVGGAPPSGSSLGSSGAGRKVMQGALDRGRPQEGG